MVPSPPPPCPQATHTTLRLQRPATSHAPTLLTSSTSRVYTLAVSCALHELLLLCHTADKGTCPRCRPFHTHTLLQIPYNSLQGEYGTSDRYHP
jgi:hypothetical protein